MTDKCEVQATQILSWIFRILLRLVANRSMPKRARTGVLLGNRRQDADAIEFIPDSTFLWKKCEWVALRQRLADDGVILIRGLIPSDQAIAARNLLFKAARHPADAEYKQYRKVY